MFFHIGNNKMLKLEDVIGIFDSDTATVSKITRTWLSDAEKKGEVCAATDQIPKSMVLTGNKKSEKIYFSQLAPRTLCQRTEKIEK